MPPKKEPKAEGKKPAEEPEPDDEEKEMLERELVIGHLRNKLGKYIDRTTHLTGEYTRLSDELETQKINLKDINEFLTNELKAKESYCLDLEQQAADLEAGLEQERAASLAQRQKLQQDHEERLEALQLDIQGYEAKLRDLNEFAERKRELETTLAELKTLLEKERRDHENIISDLERKAVQEKDRLKKEMALKIKETKANMMKLTDNQLETTTKRTIMENEQMSSELAYQSRQTEKLLQKNLKLLEDNAALKRGLELSKQTEGELAKRNHVYQKTIKTLLAKLKQQDVAKRDEEEELARQAEYAEELQGRLMETQEELSQRTDEAHTLSRTVDRSKSEVEMFRAQQDEVAKFLITCLQDVKAQIVTVVREQKDGEAEPEISVMPGRLEELSLEQRERAICYLLEKLHAFQSSKQQRLIGLGRAFEQALSLPPIASGVGSRENAAVPWENAGVRNKYDFNKRSSTTGTQTMDAGVVPEVLRSTEMTSAALAPHNSNLVSSTQFMGQHPGIGDLRTWGKKSESMPLTTKGQTTFLKKTGR
mmetsp:Transcript_26507/g.50366  ORF Transcript_26507/g.50366 Transcript_26507/m.50366 type:complete len:539 (+) Transcript_26507:469-2085(+)